MKTKQMALEALKSCNYSDHGAHEQEFDGDLVDEAITAIESDIAAKVEPIGPIEGINFRRDGNVCVPIYPGVNPHATTQQAEAPAGWKLVPMEPTEEMTYSARFALAGDRIGNIAAPIYHAMLAAAPRTAA